MSKDAFGIIRRSDMANDRPQFTDIRRQYRAFYNGSFEKVKAEWEAQCAAYKESCFSGRRQADFDNLATLEEKLNFDIDMFMETYYSSRETLPSPMLFRGINFDVVMEAVAQVPGLYSQKSGNDFQKCLFVGWDKKEVKQACKEYLTLAKENATARRLRIKQSHALSHEKKVDRAIAWRMLAHQEYLERRSRERGNHMIEGSYVVEMTFRRANREEYTPERQFMDIRATTYPGVYEATFNFTPAMEGVMVLAETEEAVQKWISFFEPDPAQAPAPTTSNNSEPQAGSKRKKNQTNDGENGSSAGPNAKRMRAASPHVLEGYSTYFMRWRGRVGIPLYKDTYRNEEGEGFVYFLESNKAQFIIDEVKVPLLADATKGYKVSDQPKFTASKWAS